MKFATVLLLACSAVCAAEQTLPDTPAGRVFGLWLQAFNGGDRDAYRAFLEKYVPHRLSHLDEELEFRKMTGGFDVLRIESPSPTTLTGAVKERAGERNEARLDFEVEAAEPHRIAKFGLRAGPDAGPPVARMTEAEAIAALKEHLAKANLSGAVLVAKHDKTLFSGAFGLADREQSKPNTLDTQFRIGSMNKMFTAVAILQLVQAGKLKLTDTVGRHMPDYPNKDVAGKVTVHHLLTHTGGTGDIFGPQYEKHRLELKTLNDYVRLYGERGLEFEPGAKHVYSNYGFLLLGALIAKISGEDYYEYVRRHVFKPAGMSLTDSLPETEAVSGRAVGYMRGGPNRDTLPWRGTSAGGGYSTVGDLAKFARALLSHKLLDAEHTRLLTTGKVDAFPGMKYAYGFTDAYGGGVRWFGHGGGAPGMNGDLRIYPESGYVVAVLANTDPPAAQRVAQFVSDRLPAK